MTATLLGLPWDGSSSFQRGAANGPGAIRAALRSESTNGWNEALMDVTEMLEDAGDLALDDAPDPRAVIEAKVTALLAQGRAPILLGGDHSVTYPIIRAVRRSYPQLTILHLDAHPDLYDNFQGDRFSHACPFARIMEEHLTDRLVQLAIRTVNRHQRDQAARFGVEMVTMKEGLSVMLERVGSLAGPVYLSVDLDGLDPACAPGVSHPEPGGLTTRELIGLIQAIPAGSLIAADVVELNPENDIRDLTARVGAKVVQEIVAGLGR